MTKQNLLTWNLNCLRKTPNSLSQNTFLVIALDVLFVILIVLLFLRIDQVLQQANQNLDVPDQLDPNNLAELQSTLANTQDLIHLILISAIIFIVVVTLLAGIFQPIAWALVAQTKLSFKYVLKALATITLAHLLIFAFMFILSNIFSQDAAALLTILAVIIISYTTLIFLINLALHPSSFPIKKSIKQAFTKAHYILPPLILTILSLVIFATLLDVIFQFAQFPYWYYVHIILLLSYLSLTRYYLLQAVKSIPKTKTS